MSWYQLDLFGQRNKLRFIYFKRKRSCSDLVNMKSWYVWSRHVLQSMYCEGGKKRWGGICSFSIISIWVKTSAPILQNLCSWPPLYLSFIKIQSTHYIASSKLHCEAQDETRKWVMQRIIRLLGGNFRRKNRWRKAWRWPPLCSCGQFRRRKTKSMWESWKFLCKYKGNRFVLCSLWSRHDTPFCQGLELFVDKYFLM